MKKSYFALVLMVILLSVGSVQAKSKVLLRLKLEKGTTYQTTMTTNTLINQEMMGQQMNVTQYMEMVISYHVLDVLPNKNFKMDYAFDKMKISSLVNGQEIVMDSDGPEDNPMNKVLKDMVGYTVKLEMTPRGEVQQVEGLDQFVQRMAGNPQLTQSMQMFGSNESFESFIDQTFNYFPEEAVEEGSKWTSSFELPSLMNTEIVMNFEVASITNKDVLLNVASNIDMDMPIEQNNMKIDMKMTGTQNGTMTVDASDGWVKESNIKQAFDMHMKMKNPQNGEDMEIPMKMESTIKMTVDKK